MKDAMLKIIDLIECHDATLTWTLRIVMTALLLATTCLMWGWILRR